MGEPCHAKVINEAFLVGTEPQSLCYVHLGVPGGSLTNMPQLLQVPAGVVSPPSQSAGTTTPVP